MKTKGEILKKHMTLMLPNWDRKNLEQQLQCMIDASLNAMEEYANQFKVQQPVIEINFK